MRNSKEPWRRPVEIPHLPPLLRRAPVVEERDDPRDADRARERDTVDAC